MPGLLKLLTKKGDTINNPKPAAKDLRQTVRVVTPAVCEEADPLRGQHLFDIFRAISHALFHSTPRGHFVKQAEFFHFSQTDLMEGYAQPRINLFTILCMSGRKAVFLLDMHMMGNLFAAHSLGTHVQDVGVKLGFKIQEAPLTDDWIHTM